MSMAKGRMLTEVEALQARVRELLDSSSKGSKRNMDEMQMSVAPGGGGYEDFVFEHSIIHKGKGGGGGGGGGE